MRRLFHLLLAEIWLTLKMTYGNFVVVSSKFSWFLIEYVKARTISLFRLDVFHRYRKKEKPNLFGVGQINFEESTNFRGLGNARSKIAAPGGM